MHLAKGALIALVTCAAALGFNPARAGSETFAFGDLLSPSSPPAVDLDAGVTWARLSVQTPNSTTNTQYMFTLKVASNSATAFGNGAFVSAAIFNIPGSVEPTGTAITGTGNGVSNVLRENNAPNGGGVTFDFGDCFGGSSNCDHNGMRGRLQAGEFVSWIASFTSTQRDPLTFESPAAALHVESISTAPGFDSAWYAPTTRVPEPKTYAMLFAGLSLMAFVVKRRRQRHVV